MTTGRPGLCVVGMAVTSGDWPGSLLPVRAAFGALDEARVPPTDVVAVMHVGDDPELAIAAAVRDGVGATRCLRTFDVGGGATNFVSALAVGASLLTSGGSVLITESEHGAASSVVLRGDPARAGAAGGGRTGTHDSLVLRSTSPVRTLLSSRAGGHRDVVLVAPGADGASVRCLLTGAVSEDAPTATIASRPRDPRPDSR